MSPAEPPQQIGFTAAESTPRFPHDPKPPAGAPNVLAIVLDDTGFGHLGCFGSDIATPHLDALAADGAAFNRFHVTSLCSPTRASFFTGRNHHAVGMGFLADIPLAYPGYTARLPKSAVALPRILRDAGYSTLAVGKWHLTPRWQRSAAGPFDTLAPRRGLRAPLRIPPGRRQPLGPQPRVRQPLHRGAPAARGGIPPQRGPGRPGHPHGARPAARRAGQALLLVLRHRGPCTRPTTWRPNGSSPTGAGSTSGWDAWRQAVFARQVGEGVVPPGTAAHRSTRHGCRAGTSSTADERRMHAAPAGGVRRIPHPHRRPDRSRSWPRSRRPDCSRTRSSWSSPTTAPAPKGGKDGSVNEHRFTAHVRESMADNLAAYDDWGGFSTYNHYSWAWAWAGNTPHKLWKRYTWLGGTRTPLIVHWPGPGGRARERCAPSSPT